MANAPLVLPRLYQQRVGFDAQRAAVTNAGNTFVAGQFVYITSGALAVVPANGTALYGLSLDKGHVATDEPYATPFGLMHNPVSPHSAVFIMNLSDGSGTVGSGSTRQQDVAIGTYYPLVYLASPYTTFAAVNTTASGTAAQNILKVVGLWNTTIASDGDAAGDFNGRVLVEILGTAIQ